MLQIQMAAMAPASHPLLLRALSVLVARTAAMGLLANDVVTRLDGATLRKVVGALQGQQLARDAQVRLGPLLKDGPDRLDALAAAKMTQQVTALNEALAQSPVPATEWTAMREALGDDTLGPLVGVSPASLRRYGSGERATPQPIAERLHWLAMVVADLSGSYNDFGIRRWFERPRQQLRGKSPREALGVDWSVDAPAALRVRELAAALVGAQPLAA